MGQSFEYHYVLAGSWLLICMGEPAPLEPALRRILKPESSPWDRPEVKADLKALSDEGAGSLGWGNPAASSLGGSITMALLPRRMMGRQRVGGELATPSPEDLARTFGRVVTSSTQEPGEYRMHLRWFPPPAEPPAP